MNQNQFNISSEISILLVIDSGATRDILTQGLKKLGLKDIKMLPTGMHALKDLKEGPFYDLVLCDKDLSDMNGLEVLREIQESEDIEAGSFALLSSQIGKGDVALAAELGCDAYLVKPFAFKELASKLVQAMRRSTDISCTEARMRRAKNLMVRELFEESYKAYIEVEESAGESARVFVGLGRAQRKLGKNEEAIQNFEKAIAKNGAYVHAYQEMGFTLLAAGKTEQALVQFESAIKISPNNPARYQIVADVLYQNKEYEKAENYLTQALKLELSYPDLYAQLGKTLFAQKKPERACKVFEKALRQDPKNTSFLNSLGICLKELGKIDEALDRYNAALKLNPQDVKVLFNKALCLIQQKQYERATKTCNLILKFDPKYTKALNKLKEIEKLVAESKAKKSA